MTTNRYTVSGGQFGRQQVNADALTEAQIVKLIEEGFKHKYVEWDGSAAHAYKAVRNIYGPDEALEQRIIAMYPVTPDPGAIPNIVMAPKDNDMSNNTNIDSTDDSDLDAAATLQGAAKAAHRDLHCAWEAIKNSVALKSLSPVLQVESVGTCLYSIATWITADNTEVALTDAARATALVDGFELCLGIAPLMPSAPVDVMNDLLHHYRFALSTAATVISDFAQLAKQLAKTN